MFKEFCIDINKCKDIKTSFLKNNIIKSIEYSIRNIVEIEYSEEGSLNFYEKKEDDNGNQKITEIENVETPFGELKTTTYAESIFCFYKYTITKDNSFYLFFATNNTVYRVRGSEIVESNFFRDAVEVYSYKSFDELLQKDGNSLYTYVLNKKLDKGVYFIQKETNQKKNIYLMLPKKLSVSYEAGKQEIYYYNYNYTFRYKEKGIEEKNGNIGGKTNDNYILEQNDFYNSSAKYRYVNPTTNDVTVYDITTLNAQKISRDYLDGKQLIEVTSPIIDFYDKDGYLIFDSYLGEIPDINDVFSFKRGGLATKMLNDGRRYKVVKFEFNYNGVPTIKITGKEI